ncbi:MAG: hypothetical protein LBK95_09995 [Bifidobacteriaceae bacterium]|nr:hypothetical protein [Bifidobacteriaceae bacterium]
MTAHDHVAAAFPAGAEVRPAVAPGQELDIQTDRGKGRGYDPQAGVFVATSRVEPDQARREVDGIGHCGG